MVHSYRVVIAIQLRHCRHGPPARSFTFPVSAANSGADGRAACRPTGGYCSEIGNYLAMADADWRRRRRGHNETLLDATAFKQRLR